MKKTKRIRIDQKTYRLRRNVELEVKRAIERIVQLDQAFHAMAENINAHTIQLQKQADLWREVISSAEGSIRVAIDLARRREKVLEKKIRELKKQLRKKNPVK